MPRCVTDLILRPSVSGQDDCQIPMTTIAEAPSLLHSPTVSGNPTRSERIGFWMYVAMGSLCVAVLIAAAMTALLS
jgi:hypothetical protein